MKKKNEKWRKLPTRAFTLPELLIAIGIFSMVATLGSSLFIQSVHETRRANLQNQIYEDARYIMTRIADEVRNGMIDYDEYYNQNVVMAYASTPGSSTALGLNNYGQNYGRYFSSFFHPGNDLALGFDCNDGGARNRRQCTSLRRTIDRNTGANPFTGKFTASAGENENAFCGNVSYDTAPRARPDNQGICGLSDDPDLASAQTQPELYLISADGRTKTILALERISNGNSVLSLLRLQGVDTNSDGISDHFVCAPGFECRGNDDVPDVDGDDHGILPTEDCGGGSALFAELPKSSLDELELNIAETCDTASVGFSKDFVPISPFHVNITDLNFSISPDENPHYAFSEGVSAQQQPRVTIQLTVTHPEISELTLVQTVSSRVLTPVPAPLLIM